MVIAAPEPKAELQPVGEQRVVLRGLTWEAYLQILNALPQVRGARLTYDDGVLEITVPLEAHEFSGRLIERFILSLVELIGVAACNHRGSGLQTSQFLAQIKCD